MVSAAKLPPPPQLDPLDPNLLTTGQLRKVVPKRDGVSIAPSTIWRWCREGREGIHLPHVRLGRSVMSTREALRWFLQVTTEARLNAADHFEPTPDIEPDTDLEAELSAEGL